MNIAPNKVASLSYTLKNEEGEILDKADTTQPFLYLHGAGGIIKGLESELLDKKSGDSFEITVSPEEAYGAHDDKLIEAIPRKMFEGIPDEEMIAGAQFHAQTGQGNQVITIASIDGDIVNIDGNHPLAGQTLHFDVAVLDVRDATQEELDHGHPHALGGCGSAPVEEKSDSCCGGGCGG